MREKVDSFISLDGADWFTRAQYEASRDGKNTADQSEPGSCPRCHGRNFYLSDDAAKALLFQV